MDKELTQAGLNKGKPITDNKPFALWKHLNKLRWCSLSVVFLMLILIPLLSIYQHYVAAQVYNHLSPSQTLLYDSMAFISSPFVDDPEH